MKKNEKDWFAVLAGKKAPGMDPKMRLQARLVRAVFRKNLKKLIKK